MLQVSSGQCKDTIFGSIANDTAGGLWPAVPFGTWFQYDPMGIATTDNRQPTTDNRQPTTGNRQPTTGNRQPTTDNRQPLPFNKDEPCHLLLL